MKRLLLVFCSINTLFLSAIDISEKGYWIGQTCEEHVTDFKLAQSIYEFLSQEYVRSVVDFGCGEGKYVKYLRDRGIDAIGFDGNPETPKISNGVASVLDLSVSVNLNRKFDWVISLEVGEHLPHQYETVFIENLVRHAKDGIILSWAIKGQGGTGHFNEQNNDYIRNKLQYYGFQTDPVVEQKLRKDVSCGWFRQSLMVFRKNKL